jgi:GDP-D-mannose dehydratase
MSHVKLLLKPEYTGNVDVFGNFTYLDAVRLLGLEKTRIYQASTLSCMVKYRKCHNRKQLHFTHVRLM